MSKRPAIQFRGFSEEWEERKLNSIFKCIRNAFVGTATPYYVSEGHFYLESNNVKDGQINRNSEIFINDEFYYRQRDKWLHTNDMVMVQSGHVGHAAVIPENLDNSAAHALIMFTDRMDDTYPHFLNYQYQTRKSARKISDITKGNTIKHILASDMKEFVVSVPEVTEQHSIADLFMVIDQSIMLHQHKHDKLLTYKKAMLEKMFPKDSADVPEVRLVGFTGSWDRNKLSAYLEVSIDKNTDDIYGKGDVLSVSGEYGIVNQIEFQGRSFAGASVSNYGVVQTNDVVYTKSPLNTNPYGIIKANKGKTGIVSTLYAVYHPRENADSAFIQTYFEQHARMNNYMHPLVNKGAKNDMKVSAENALNGLVIFPKRQEQQHIVAFFSRLDQLISLHRRKLEKLKTIKAALLDKMFI